jgi:hypothetical protein
MKLMKSLLANGSALDLPGVLSPGHGLSAGWHFEWNHCPMEYLEIKKMDVPKNSHNVANLTPHFNLFALISLM